MTAATFKLARLSSAVRALGYATLLIAAILPFAQQASAAPPTYQAAGTIQSGTAALTGATAVAWPAHAINDIGLLIIETQNEAVTLGTNAANWTQVTNSPQGTGTTNNTGTRLTVFWSRATSTSMGAVGVNDSGDHQIAQIITFRGVVATGNQPWDVTAGDTTPSTTTAVSIPGATTTVQDTLAVAIVSNGSDLSAAQVPGSFTNSDLSSVTKRQDSNTTASGGGGFTVATGVKALAGAYGRTSATLGFSSLQGRMSIALRPPFTKLQLLMPGETAAPGTASGKTGTPNVTAGNAFTVTVNAVDANWYVVTSAPADTVGITSTDTNATMPGNLALSSGTQTFSVTLMTAGTNRSPTGTHITAGTNTPYTNSPLTQKPGAVTKLQLPVAGETAAPMTVRAGASAKRQLLAPGETATPGAASSGSGKTGSPNAQPAGWATFTVTVNAVDAAWTAVCSTDTVGLTSTDAGAMPGNQALASGTQTFSVTLRTAGSQTLSFIIIPPPPRSPLFPFTTVSRSSFTKLQLLVPGET